MTTTIQSTPQSRLSASAKTLLLAAGALVAVGVNWVIGAIALAAGADADFKPLAVYVFGPFTVIAFAAASLGWRWVRSRASHPAALLRVLVPVLTVLSFAPDAVLLATGFIPGSSVTAVVALALMHLLVATVVAVARRVASVRATPKQANCAC